MSKRILRKPSAVISKRTDKFKNKYWCRQMETDCVSASLQSADSDRVCLQALTKTHLDRGEKVHRIDAVARE